MLCLVDPREQVFELTNVVERNGPAKGRSENVEILLGQQPDRDHIL